MPAQAKRTSKFVPPQDKTRLMMMLQALQVLSGPEMDSKLFETEVKALGAAITKLAIGE